MKKNKNFKFKLLLIEIWKSISRLSPSNLIILNRYYIWANINLDFSGILKTMIHR